MAAADSAERIPPVDRLAGTRARDPRDDPGTGERRCEPAEAARQRGDDSGFGACHHRDRAPGRIETGHARRQNVVHRGAQGDALLGGPGGCPLDDDRDEGCTGGVGRTGRVRDAPRVGRVPHRAQPVLAPHTLERGDRR
ncbi:hypothetical protein F8M49_26170 [Rhodococcus zopfii]|uniref:Uncharacterized protein n=1 Tax=Rhodococcus zopfii TaxID=43772 RepID=A0ABU3WW78_9NOCA|nr:hypothetical protein [Rhodococcus zopfii]